MQDHTLRAQSPRRLVFPRASCHPVPDLARFAVHMVRANVIPLYCREFTFRSPLQLKPPPRGSKLIAPTQSRHERNSGLWRRGTRPPQRNTVRHGSHSPSPIHVIMPHSKRFEKQRLVRCPRRQYSSMKSKQQEQQLRRHHLYSLKPGSNFLHDRVLIFVDSFRGAAEGSGRQ